MFNNGDVVFGHWTVDEKIGSGAYGTVYKLKREEFGTEYFSALKVVSIPPENVDSDALKSEGMTADDISTYYADIAKSFMEEIKLLEELKGNSNIVSYEDHIISRSDDGMSYVIMIRMELLKPFKTILAEKELDKNEICRLGIHMCNALELCEKKKIIHRDIKPDNIFLSSADTYKLGDFGVARTMEKTVSAMSQKGTYTYMAPEVFLGKEYNSNVDLYSLGILLYQLLNGNRTPFLPDSSTAVRFADREEARKKRMSGELVPEIKSLDDNWNRFLVKACHPDPEKRYQTATEMKNDLISLQNGPEVTDSVVKKKNKQKIRKPEKSTVSNNSKRKKLDTQTSLPYLLFYSLFNMFCSICNDDFYSYSSIHIFCFSAIAIILIVVIVNIIVSFKHKGFLNNYGILYLSMLSIFVNSCFWAELNEYSSFYINLCIFCIILNIFFPVIMNLTNKKKILWKQIVGIIVFAIIQILNPIMLSYLRTEVHFALYSSTQEILLYTGVAIFALIPVVIQLILKIKTAKKNKGD